MFVVSQCLNQSNKEVFNLIFIGIDIAKDHHDIAIINDCGEILNSHLHIENSASGFKKLHMEIRSHMKSLDDIHIGVEETGIYHENLRDFLIAQGYTVYSINPKLTYHSRLSSSPRRTKTDKLDAIAITRYIMNSHTVLHSYTPSLYHLDELKQLSRSYHNKKILLSKAKTELKRLLQITFPEFLKHFNPYSKWALDILKDYPTPTHYKGLHITALAQRIKTKHDRLEDASLLKQIAVESIGRSNELQVILMKAAIDDMNHYQAQLEVLKAVISKKMRLFPKVLSMPGIGSINGATILGETGDIHRFSNKHEYYAFYGCDPVIHESGNFKLKRSRLSKTGNKYLRTAIYSASRVACVGPAKDNKFRRKYLSMTQKENKHHNTIIFAIAKNMVHSLFTMIKQNQFYYDQA